MFRNNKSIKKFQKRKIDDVNQSQKKFAKKKGGAINIPIYRSIPQGEGENICQPLTSLNQKITEIIKEKNTEKIQALSFEELKGTVPLYDFKQRIYDMCEINGIPISKEVPILLVDQHYNYVFSNYTNLIEEGTKVQLFRMTPQFQLEYLGIIDKNEEDYPLYTYDQLYEKNYQYTKDTYWINTLKALDTIEPSSFYNICNFNVEYEDENKESKNITLEKYKNFLNIFFPQRSPRDQDGNIIQDAEPITIITNENNIVKNLSFLNKIEELIKLVNDDYAYYFTNKYTEYINKELSEISDMKSIKIRCEQFIVNIPTQLKRETFLKYLKTTFNKNDNEKLKKFNKDLNNELRSFKLALISGETPLVLDLKFLIALYNELFGNNGVFDLFNKISPFQDFLYSCILIHKSGFYNKFQDMSRKKNIEGTHTNNNVNNNTFHYDDIFPKKLSLLEGFLEIKDGYVFMDLASTIYTNTGFKLSEDHFVKPYIKKMNVKIDDHILKFFDEINQLILTIHLVRDEFVNNKIGFCNEILKSVFLRTYVSYLKKGGDDIIRPISVKSHFNKFTLDAIKNS